MGNDGVLSAAATLRKDADFPVMIVVRAGRVSPMVVLRLMARLTAYALVPEAVPDELDVLLGTSLAIAD